jgi:amino-acid N-acetyltransferase
MDISLRPASKGDLPAIEALLSSAHLPTEGVAPIVEGGRGVFVVAESSGALIAAGALEEAGRDYLLRSIVVNDSARGTGVGRRIVERLLSDADARRAPGVYLLTTTADAWFPRFGFARIDRSSVPAAVGETWEFKTGCAQTAIAMKRTRVEG